MELAGELGSEEVGDIDDDRGKRPRRDTKQLPRSKRRDVDPEPEPSPRMRDHRRSLVQPTHKTEEGAGRLSPIRHRDDLRRLSQAEPEGESTRGQSAVNPGRQAGERVRFITTHYPTGGASRPRKELAVVVASHAADHSVTLGQPVRSVPSRAGRTNSAPCESTSPTTEETRSPPHSAICSTSLRTEPRPRTRSSSTTRKRHQTPGQRRFIRDPLGDRRFLPRARPNARSALVTRPQDARISPAPLA